MRIPHFIWLFCGLIFLSAGEVGQELMEGDVIFQTSGSGQSVAIQLATGSPYSHCGILFREKDQWYVLEAVQPVKRTPLDTWINQGRNGRYVVRRLKDTDLLTAEMISSMKKEGKKMEGKDYDLTFEWSDDRIYCSELVWKIYRRTTGLEPGKLQRLRDFDLSAAPVKQKIRERYGDDIPLDEQVISPGAIFESDLFHTIRHN